MTDFWTVIRLFIAWLTCNRLPYDCFLETDELLSKNSRKVDDCMLARIWTDELLSKNSRKVDDCMLARIWTDELLSTNSRKVDDCMLTRIWTDELLSKKQL